MGSLRCLQRRRGPILYQAWRQINALPDP